MDEKKPTKASERLKSAAIVAGVAILFIGPFVPVAVGWPSLSIVGGVVAFTAFMVTVSHLNWGPGFVPHRLMLLITWLLAANLGAVVLGTTTLVRRYLDRGH